MCGNNNRVARSRLRYVDDSWENKLCWFDRFIGFVDIDDQKKTENKSIMEI